MRAETHVSVEIALDFIENFFVITFIIVVHISLRTIDIFRF